MLSNALGPLADSLDLDARRLLADAGIDGRRRPETLTLDELLRLARLMAQAPPAVR